MWTFGPIAPPGIGKPTTRASAEVVTGLNSYSLKPSFSSDSISSIFVWSMSRL